MNEQPSSISNVETAAILQRPPSIKECNLMPQNWVITCKTEIGTSVTDSECCFYQGEYSFLEDYNPINFNTLKTSKSVSKTVNHSKLNNGKKKKNKTNNGGRRASLMIPSTKGNISGDDGDDQSESDSCSSPAASFLESKTNFSINLFETAKRLRHLGVQYNPSGFHALILKLRQPSGVVLVFSTGTILCTGPKKHYVVTYLLNYTVSLLRNHGYPGLRIKPGSWTIQNIVAHATLPDNLNLNHFYSKHSNCCNYEPTIFPGASYRVKCTSVPRSKGVNVTILLFSSGKLVITGAKEEHHIKDALIECLPDIWDSRTSLRKEKKKKRKISFVRNKKKKIHHLKDK